MKVTFVFPGPYPSGRVTPRRAHLLCKGLLENGIDVLMLIPGPTEKNGHIFNSEPDGNFEGVKYHYLGSKVIRNENIIIRQLTKVWCYSLLFFNLMVNKYNTDFLVVLGASFDYRILLPWILKLTRIKSILEINEYPLVTRRNKLTTRLKRWIIFNLVFPLYDGFIPISTELDILAKTCKSMKATSIIIPIIGRQISSIRKNNTANPVNCKYIFHAGSLLEQKDGILGMIKAFGIAKQHLSMPLKFVFTGNIENSPHKDEIQNLIDEYHLKGDITFTGFLPDDQLDLYFRYASMAIINKGRTLQNKYCFASKAAEYLAYSIAVITTKVGDIKFYLTDGNNAYVIQPDDPKLLAEKIAQAFNNNAERERIAIGGKGVFDLNFDYKIQGRRLSQYLISFA